MHRPPSFAVDDPLALLVELVERHTATLVTTGPDGLAANPVPLLVDTDGEQLRLHGHVAAANREVCAAHDRPALAVVLGPEGYVSPGWYPSKALDPAVVPTWNHVAVEARGRLEVWDDPDRLLGLVSALTDRHEDGRVLPWSVTDAPGEWVGRQLRAIRGFTLHVERLQGKAKLSQNRSVQDRLGVAEGLRTEAGHPQLSAAVRSAVDGGAPPQDRPGTSR